MQVSTNFDFTPYRRVPIVSARAEYALGRALLEARPIGRGSSIDHAAWRIAELLNAIEDALPARRDDEPSAPAGDGEGFEDGTEALWEVLRGRLTTWQGFEHPGLDPLIARGDGLARAIEVGRDKAERARACAQALFAGAGLRVFRGRYDEQSADMGVILRLIDERDLGAEIEELVGEEILPALVGCQQRYREMVEARSCASGDAKLGELHRQLHRSLELYVIAVLGLLVSGAAEDEAIVRGALRPIVVLRTQMADGRWLAGEEEPVLVDDLDDDAGLASVFEVAI